MIIINSSDVNFFRSLIECNIVRRFNTKSHQFTSQFSTEIFILLSHSSFQNPEVHNVYHRNGWIRQDDMSWIASHPSNILSQDVPYGWKPETVHDSPGLGLIGFLGLLGIKGIKGLTLPLRLLQFLPFCIPLLLLLLLLCIPIPVIVYRPSMVCSNLIVRQVSENWMDSYNSCQNQGGSLVTVESQFKYDCIISKIREAGLPDDIVYWTAGTDSQVEGDFIWETTGDPVQTFYPVGNTQPDNGAGGIVENCIGLRKVYPPQPPKQQHEMNDEQCGLLYYSICDV